ncbi:MAG TPA: 50S ribosomal protein L11 methyltransferase [Methylocystis sp.]|nr:50S ribosomal protein L11 methyltransferase [Methylocystis sp.]
MSEPPPQNRASRVLRLVADERRARAVADLIVESFDADEAATSAFALEDGAANWAVEAYFETEPDEAELRALIESATDPETGRAAQFTTIAERDWVAAALAGLTPVRAGRVVAHGAHDRGKLHSNDVGVEIEAALAFGTGHHGTTLGCLLALDRILKRRRPRHVLDVGTGTGVLAIAAAKLLRQPVACGDIDPVSVATARANALANGVGAFVRPVLSDGLRSRSLRARRADLIFANILARPLRLLAPSLARVAAPGADLVLSGLLSKDVAGVVSAFRAQGCTLVERRDIDGWATLALKK